MQGFRALVAMGALLLAAPAGAQQALTLAAAVEATLAGNPALAAARAGAVEAETHVDAARAGRLPAVSFGESWQRSNEPVTAFGARLNARRFTAADFAVDVLNHPGATSAFSTLVGLEQVVFDGGRTSAGVDAARAGADGAAAAARIAAADTALAVSRAYGAVLAAERGLAAISAAEAAAAEDHARAERRRAAGTATDADVLSLAVHLADVRQQAIARRADLDIRRAELNRLMGVPLDAAAPLVVPAPDPVVTEDLATLTAEAEAARPELAAAAAAVEAADAGRRSATAGWWPTVTARAGYQLHGVEWDSRASAWAIGGDLRWSWSTGGATAAAARGAAQAATRARAEQADARAGVALEVLTAVRTAEAAAAREAVGQAAVELARESQRIVRNRYEAGLAGVTDLLHATAAVLAADERHATAAAGRIEAEAALRRALGRPFPNPR